MALIAFPETQLSSEGKSDSPTGASKLRVGPAFLAERFLSGSRDIFGPYWVGAVGEDRCRICQWRLGGAVDAVHQVACVCASCMWQPYLACNRPLMVPDSCAAVPVGK